MIKKLLSFFLWFFPVNLILGQSSTNAREYENSIGLRGGFTYGINFRHFQKDNMRAIEAILGFWPDALGFTLLVEKFKATEVNGLLLYLGFGAHFTEGNNRNYYTSVGGRKVLQKYLGSDRSFGLDGLGGVEFKIPKIPFILNAEIKPFLDIDSNGCSFLYIDPAVGIRVYF